MIIKFAFGYCLLVNCNYFYHNSDDKLEQKFCYESLNYGLHVVCLL